MAITYSFDANVFDEDKQSHFARATFYNSDETGAQIPVPDYIGIRVATGNATTLEGIKAKLDLFAVLVAGAINPNLKVVMEAQPPIKFNVGGTQVGAGAPPA